MQSKKYILGFISKNGALACSLFLLSGFLVAGPILAADPTTPGGLAAIKTGIQNTAKGAQLTTGGGNLEGMIGNIIGAVLGLVGVILFGYMVYGGFRWMTAAGEAKAVTDAQAIIKNALIGIVIIALAYAISNYVLDILLNAQKTSTGVPASPGK